MYTCIGLWENGNSYPPYQDAVYTSPHGGHQKFQWEGGPRGGNFQGGGVWFSRSFFSREFETIIIVFIDDFTFTVITQNAFFTAYLYDYCYSLHVYECHRLMNYAGHPAHCFIFHNIIVVFTVLWSCPISLLLTCF